MFCFAFSWRESALLQLPIIPLCSIDFDWFKYRDSNYPQNSVTSSSSFYEHDVTYFYRINETGTRVFNSEFQQGVESCETKP